MPLLWQLLGTTLVFQRRKVFARSAGADVAFSCSRLQRDDAMVCLEGKLVIVLAEKLVEQAKAFHQPQRTVIQRQPKIATSGFRCK